MNDWILNRLSEILDFPVPDEMVCLIHQMPNDRDLDNYMESFLESSNPTHQEFLRELKKKRAQDAILTGYRKSNDNNYGTVKFKDTKKNKGKELNIKISGDSSQQEKETKFADKKTKFNILYSQNNFSTLSKHHNRCDCEARNHELINNCLNCGRIICKQEGIGSCFFCSEPLQIEKKLTILAEKKCQPNLLKHTINNQQINNVDLLLKERNKLLEYDRDSTKRNQVIDDECDYYMSNNSWLSKSERQQIIQKDEELSELKFSSKKKKSITIDLNNKSFFEENKSSNHVLGLELTTTQRDHNHGNNKCDLQYPDLKVSHLQYIHQGLPKLPSNNASDLRGRRVQDKELIEMVDEGFCMTVDQPYASFLIAGFNLHVGKSWYSSHRGRLWIHAAVPKTLSTEIPTVEYKCTSSQENYAMSSDLLLGFVTVVDILSQDEYQKKYPENDIHSPYVFICVDPHEVASKIPMQGKPKIYKLERKIHQTATRSQIKINNQNESNCY